MARSTYIYLVRRNDGTLLGAFTVKREAHDKVLDLEMDNCGLKLSRLRDGQFGDEEEIPWEFPDE